MDVENRTFAGNGLGLHMPLRLFDDGVDDGQSQSHAFLVAPEGGILDSFSPFIYKSVCITVLQAEAEFLETMQR